MEYSAVSVVIVVEYMSKYYSNTIRIISIITLIAFISIQVAFGYEGRPASIQSQKSHLRVKQFGDGANSTGVANIAGEPETAVTEVVAPAADAGRRSVPEADAGANGLANRLPTGHRHFFLIAENTFKGAISGAFKFDHILILTETSSVLDNTSTLSWGGAALMICPLVRTLHEKWPDKNITVVTEYSELIEALDTNGRINSISPQEFNAIEFLRAHDETIFAIDFDDSWHSKYFSDIAFNNKVQYLEGVSTVLQAPANCLDSSYSQSVKQVLLEMGFDVPENIIKRIKKRNGVVFVNIHSHANKQELEEIEQKRAWADMLKSLISEGYKVVLYAGERISGTMLTSALDLDQLESLMDLLKEENFAYLDSIETVGPYDRRELLKYILNEPEAIITIQTGIFHIGAELSGIPAVVVTGMYDEKWIPKDEKGFRSLTTWKVAKNPELAVEKLKELGVLPLSSDAVLIDDKAYEILVIETLERVKESRAKRAAVIIGDADSIMPDKEAIDIFPAIDIGTAVLKKAEVESGYDIVLIINMNDNTVQVPNLPTPVAMTDDVRQAVNAFLEYDV